MNVLFTVLVTFFAGMGAGLGTGFAPAAPKEGFDAIPMWVADMNFPVVPTIQQEVIARVQHPAFGYFDPSDEYYNAILQWQARRNGVTGLEKQHIGYENGVLGGVIWMNTGGPQAVFLIGGAATVGAGLVARRMDRPQP